MYTSCTRELCNNASCFVWRKKINLICRCVISLDLKYFNMFSCKNDTSSCGMIEIIQMKTVAHTMPGTYKILILLCLGYIFPVYQYNSKYKHIYVTYSCLYTGYYYRWVLFREVYMPYPWSHEMYVCRIYTEKRPNSSDGIFTNGLTVAGPSLHMKTVFPCIRISIIKMGPLISIIGIPILVKRYLYIETAPRTRVYYRMVLTYSEGYDGMSRVLTMQAPTTHHMRCDFFNDYFNILVMSASIFISATLLTFCDFELKFCTTMYIVQIISSENP